MTDESKSLNISTLIIGLIIGGFITYLLLKPKLSIASLQQQTKFDNSSIENKLQNIEQRLQQLQQSQQSNVQTNQTQQTPLQNNIYKNNEIRKYIRDDKGRISSTQIIRDAKIS